MQRFAAWLFSITLVAVALVTPLFNIEMIANSPTGSSQTTQIGISLDGVEVQQEYSSGARDTYPFENAKENLPSTFSLLGYLESLIVLIMMTCIIGLIFAYFSDEVYTIPYIRKFLFLKPDMLPTSLKNKIRDFGIDNIFRWLTYCVFLLSIVSLLIAAQIPGAIAKDGFSFVTGLWGSSDVNYQGYTFQTWGPSVGGYTLGLLVFIFFIGAGIAHLKVKRQFAQLDESQQPRVIMDNNEKK